MIKPLQDGVYLGLPEDDYFGQAALGTTDLTKLYQRKRGWWWQSRHNPRRRDEPTKAMTFGRALHTALLEGPGHFAQRFAVAPEPEAFRGLLRTTDDIRQALEHEGHPLPGAKAKKSDFLEYARLYLPQAPVWDSILEDFDRKRGEREAITAQEEEELQLMVALAREEPLIRDILPDDEELALTELSVFWTLADGVRLRYRFDALVPAGNIDLKAVGNAFGPFEEATGKRIRDYELDVQLAQSFEARKAAYELIGRGKFFGGSKAQRAYIRQFPKRAPLNAGSSPGWAWLWIFYQRPDAKAGSAPTILPAWVRYGEQLHREGWRKIQRALATYREAFALFGLERPWTELMPTHAFEGTGPQVRLPPWGQLETRVEGEDAAMEWRA